MLGAAVMVLAACGSSGNRYLANRNEKVYLRVPTDWHDIKLSDSLKDPVLQVTSDARIISKSVISPQANASEQKDLDLQTPMATMTVYETRGVFNQRLSPSLARQTTGLVGFDPMLPTDETDGLSEVIDFDPNPTNAKVSGSRVVYRARSDKSGDWALTINLSTYFDASESRLYSLEVTCTPECYEQSSAEIDRIVNSWRIG